MGFRSQYSLYDNKLFFKYQASSINVYQSENMMYKKLQNKPCMKISFTKIWIWVFMLPIHCMS